MSIQTNITLFFYIWNFLDMILLTCYAIPTILDLEVIHFFHIKNFQSKYYLL